VAENAAPELCVFFDCHGMVVAMPVRRVERLLLAEEVAVRPESSHGVSIALVQRRPYAAWNLGRLLELPPLSTAWVLLRIPHEGADLPLALNTGRCLLVGSLGRHVTSIPPGLFRDRHSALWGTFPTGEVSGARLGGVMGLCLDPLRLWHGPELASSASALLSVRL
jgi:hypothetical protein